jgi:hypothetical protein
MTEDKKEFDYIVNILTRISDVDVRRFGVFDYIETPEVYVNAEEVADKIGSSVELNGSRTKRTGGASKK